MKKILASLAAILIAGSVFAGSTNVVTNTVGQVFTVVIDQYGMHISTPGTTPGLPAAASRTLVSAIGAQVISKAAVAVPTAYTPRDIGDMLIGLYGTGTNGVWVATGVSTNDWALTGTSLVP